MTKLIEVWPLRCASMTGLSADRFSNLIGRVREIVGVEWEKPAVGRPHVLPLPTAVIAALFGLRHNLSDEVLGEIFGCSQATITRYTRPCSRSCAGSQGLCKVEV
ncbi:transposase family protein [Actinoplanes sp. G11-F43]|uniref:transposase family protein n=1 Tax=Actinoplanes sp. G11-F43 TaxID=3424130 RepID=UPI003D33B384